MEIGKFEKENGIRQETIQGETDYSKFHEEGILSHVVADPIILYEQATLDNKFQDQISENLIDNQMETIFHSYANKLDGETDLEYGSILNRINGKNFEEEDSDKKRKRGSSTKLPKKQKVTNEKKRKRKLRKEKKRVIVVMIVRLVY